MTTTLVLVALIATGASAEPDYDQMAATIATVESRNNPDAIGDRGRAVGLHQTWKVMVDELNRRVGYLRWSYEDRADPAKSAEMVVFFLITEHRLHPAASRLWLMCRWRNPHGPAPNWYVRKLKLAIKKTQNGNAIKR